MTASGDPVVPSNRHPYRDPLCPVSISAYDFSQTADLIHRAEAAMRLWAAQGSIG